MDRGIGLLRGVHGKEVNLSEFAANIDFYDGFPLGWDLGLAWLHDVIFG